MAFPTALDGPGIFSLERIQLFFKKMKISLSKVIIKQDYFDIEFADDSDNQRLFDFVAQTKLGLKILIFFGQFPNNFQS